LAGGEQECIDKHWPIPYFRGMALIVVLLCAGLLLLFLETILPGMIAGIIGFFCLVGSVVTAYTDQGPKVGNLVFFAVLVLLVVGTLIWIKFFPDTPMARMFVSHRQIGTVHAEKPELIGQTGTAQTILRPAGSALINGKRVDVVTEGGFVEKGKPVKVVAVEGLRVVVRET
jgi:membrane-bound serine protease (ClpP class)